MQEFGVLSYIVVLLTGLAVGSFLNAFIYRLEVKEGLVRSPSSHKPSVLRGRSFCPSCGHMLSWHDLIPLLSFVFLRGRCRYCVKPISLQYPFVELSTGLLFVALFAFVGQNLVRLSFSNLTELSFPQGAEILYLWVIASLLMVIFVYDLKHYIIPDKVLMPAIGLVVLWRGFEFLDFDIWNLFGIWDLGFGISPPLLAAIASGVGAASFFLAIYLVSKGGAMGFGDVKLALFMGLFLGWPGILVALAFAFGAGALIGIGLLLAKKKTMRSEVPFGPFLVLGAFVALFWGKAIVDFYLRLVMVY